MRQLTACVLLGVFIGTVASADPPIGSRLGERIERNPIKQERDSALGAQEMARCLVNKQTGTVRRFLAAIDQAESERLNKAMGGEHECFNMTEGNDFVEGRLVMFPHDVFRGMLAEWMIKKDTAAFAALPVLPRQLAYSRSWYPRSGRDSSVDEMATCVTEIAPAETIALLKTDPYSDMEGTAFGALGRHLGECLRVEIGRASCRERV